MAGLAKSAGTRGFLLVMAALLITGLMFTGPVSAGEKYLGTDDLIDKKAQEVAGISAGEPLIDLSQGNLGLFFFTAGGFTAGTIFGYYWRKLFVEKAGREG